MNGKQSLTMGPTSELVVLANWRPDIIRADKVILHLSRFQKIFDDM